MGRSGGAVHPEDVCGLGGRSDLLLHGILGNAFLTGGVDDEGETLDVGDQAIHALVTVAMEAGAAWAP